MISLPNEPPSLRQLNHLRNISWFGLLPSWQAVTCGVTEAQQQFGRLPSADSAHSFVPLFVSLPSFSSSSANTKFYMYFVKSFFRGNANNAQGKGLAAGMTDSCQTFPQAGITPAGWHQTSTPPMKTGAVSAASWNRWNNRAFWQWKFQEQFISTVSNWEFVFIRVTGILIALFSLCLGRNSRLNKADG